MKAALIISLAILAGAADARDLPRCDLMNGNAVGQWLAQDHGGGIVSFLSGGYDQGFSGTSLRIVACPSQQSVSIGVSAGNIPDDGSGYDVYDEVSIRFDELLSSSHQYTPEDVATEMAAISPSVIVETDLARQPCACAVAYPFSGSWEQRFQRQPWH
ncbi:MAG: hypothetical protein AAGA70_12400 [Pseudomonadota bacterium]